MRFNEKDMHSISAILESYKDSVGTDVMKTFAHHTTVSTYEHCMNVVNVSYWMSKKMNFQVDVKSLVVGAYLHDYYLYDCHTESRGRFHQFRHPRVALKNAQDQYELNDKEKNIIESHMWPLTITKLPKSKEAFIICMADKYCALVELLTKKKRLRLQLEC